MKAPERLFEVDLCDHSILKEASATAPKYAVDPSRMLRCGSFYW